MRTSDVLLSVWMVVRGCRWPSSSSVLHMGTGVLTSKNNEISSSSAADDITVWMIVDRLRTPSLFGGFHFSFDRNWWSPAQLCAFFFYE